MSQNRTYKARVTDNNDPEKRGRLLLECPDFMAEGVSFPDWIEGKGLFNWKGDSGIFAVPEVGSFVDLEIEEAGSNDTGMSGIPHVLTPAVRWKPRTEFATSEGVPSEAKENYPHRIVWKTTAGHVLIFDRETGELFLQEATEGTTLIYLGREADTFAVRFDELKNWCDNHTHPTGIGPTGVPSTPLPANVASTVIKVK